MNKAIKVNVEVYNEYVQLDANWSTFNTGDYEVTPTKITRVKAGRFTPMRYHYQVHFVGVDGMLSCLNEPLLGVETCENIIRKKNPKFNPKKLEWDGDTAFFEN